jgi:hypothetical protein
VGVVADGRTEHFVVNGVDGVVAEINRWASSA